MLKLLKPIAAIVLAGTSWLAATAAQAETLRLSPGFGVINAPLYIMKGAHLLEKHAKEAGIDLKAEWIPLPSAGAANDALLSNNLDIVSAGVANMVIIWAASKGRVKAVAAVSGVNSVLVTKDPNIKTLADFKENHRISVPTVKVSTQAVYLAMALEEKFGDSRRLDSNMVQLGHTDGMQAMLNPNGPIQAQFTGPPFYQELLSHKGMHAVISSMEIAGPATNVVAYTTADFVKKNPKLIAIFLAALKEADKMIKDDPLAAAKLYLDSSQEKFRAEEVAKQFSDEGSVFQIMPNGVQRIAQFMYRSGLIKQYPESWRDVFFDNLNGLEGIENAN